MSDPKGLLGTESAAAAAAAWSFFAAALGSNALLLAALVPAVAQLLHLEACCLASAALVAAAVVVVVVATACGAPPPARARLRVVDADAPLPPGAVLLVTVFDVSRPSGVDAGSDQNESEMSAATLLLLTRTR